MVDPLKEADAIKIDSEGLIKVERPLVKYGLLRLELKGEFAGKILIDRREHPLSRDKRTRLYFNATALYTSDKLPLREKEARLAIREMICKNLDAVDNSEQIKEGVY
ncbi:MAG: hypothetical protein PHG80_12690 [Methanoregulaceae archaeon]|nr:hypothetical protein [Methanoregulaceae archaeon]